MFRIVIVSLCLARSLAYVVPPSSVISQDGKNPSSVYAPASPYSAWTTPAFHHQNADVTGKFLLGRSFQEAQPMFGGQGYVKNAAGLMQPYITPDTSYYGQTLQPKGRMSWGRELQPEQTIGARQGCSQTTQDVNQNPPYHGYMSFGPTGKLYFGQSFQEYPVQTPDGYFRGSSQFYPRSYPTAGSSGQSTNSNGNAGGYWKNSPEVTQIPHAGNTLPNFVTQGNYPTVGTSGYYSKNIPGTVPFATPTFQRSEQNFQPTGNTFSLSGTGFEWNQPTVAADGDLKNIHRVTPSSTPVVFHRSFQQNFSPVTSGYPSYAFESSQPSVHAGGYFKTIPQGGQTSHTPNVAYVGQSFHPSGKVFPTYITQGEQATVNSDGYLKNTQPVTETSVASSTPLSDEQYIQSELLNQGGFPNSNAVGYLKDTPEGAQARTANFAEYNRLFNGQKWSVPTSV